MRLRNLKLGTKQKLGFGLILFVMACVNIFSVRKMALLKGELDEVSKNRLPKAIAISDINLNTSRLRFLQLQHAFADDEATIRSQQNLQSMLIDRINTHLDTYEALKAESEQHNLYSAEEDTLFSEVDWKWEEYQVLSLEFLSLVETQQTQNALELLNREARDVFTTLSDYLEELVTINKNNALQAAIRADVMLASTRRVTVTLLLVTIVLSGALGAVFVRYITVPVRQLEKAARDIAEGDLNVQLDVPSTDEIGNLASSFNRMTLSLRDAREKLELQADDLRTKNRELENALHELQTTQDQLMMKEKMAALGDLVAGIAHEINNPIGTVTSSTDVSNRCFNRIAIILEESKSLQDIKSNPELPQILNILQESIQITRSAAIRIATIVKSLKNFATLDESGFQRADIHEGIESTLTLMASELRGRVTIIKDYGDIPKIGCYPGLLNQMFLNVLKNASQSIEDSGTITIRTFKEDNHVHVKISDTGKGIPAEQLSTIFQFGFSAVGTRVKMGSGLATAYNIVQKHHGEISVDSKVGTGTTLNIILPIPSSLPRFRSSSSSL
jgi:signal transduction histidine kinase